MITGVAKVTNLLSVISSYFQRVPDKTSKDKTSKRPYIETTKQGMRHNREKSEHLIRQKTERQNIKFQQVLLTKIQNSVQNVYIVTHGSCENILYILNYLYVKFTCLRQAHILPDILFNVSKCSECAVLHVSVSHE